MTTPQDYYDPDLDPRRERIQEMLRRNYQVMMGVYGIFSVGWFLLLFTSQSRSGALLMIVPLGAFAVYSRLRNRGIRRLGFSEIQPYPSSWSEEFHDREPEAFKAFTTLWTFTFFAWAILKYVLPQ